MHPTPARTPASIATLHPSGRVLSIILCVCVCGCRISSRMGFLESYSETVVKYPRIVLTSSVLFALGFGGLAFAVKDNVRPELDKAAKGFESRGVPRRLPATHTPTSAAHTPYGALKLAHRYGACRPHHDLDPKH